MSETTVRILDGASEIARHRRSYDRHQRVEDPAHVEALLEEKRRARGSVPRARLNDAVPAAEAFLEACFQRGESVAATTEQLLLLLDDYGAAELSAAVTEALARQTPRLSSVAFLLARRRRTAQRRMALPVELSRRPDLRDLYVKPHLSETYDELARRDERTTMTNATDLTARLSKVGLVAIANGLDDFLARATKGRWSPAQILEEIARLEQVERTRRSLQSRLQRARIGRFKPIADFDWNWPKKIERDLIERALGLDFIREGRNLALIGTNGLGKTMIARNIAHQAVLAGFSVLCTTAAELIEDLRSCGPETLRRRLGRYTRPHLLTIDEVGYLAYDSHAADLLYKVVDRRYERPGARDLPSRSILITTNLAFGDVEHRLPQRHLDRHAPRQAHPPRRRHPDRGRELSRAREPKGSRRTPQEEAVTNRARQAYVDAVVTNYVRLPGTPLRASRQDRLFARMLYEQRVPLRVVYAAFVLAIARREVRSASQPRLPAIRTLRFFQGAIDEVVQTEPRPRLRPLPRSQDQAARRRERRRAALRPRPHVRFPRFLTAANWAPHSRHRHMDYSAGVLAAAAQKTRDSSTGRLGLARASSPMCCRSGGYAAPLRSWRGRA